MSVVAFPSSVCSTMDLNTPSSGFSQYECDRIRRCCSPSAVRNTTQLLPGSVTDRVRPVPDRPCAPRSDVPSVSRKVDRPGPRPVQLPMVRVRRGLSKAPVPIGLLNYLVDSLPSWPR